MGLSIHVLRVVLRNNIHWTLMLMAAEGAKQAPQRMWVYW